jgi:hypothetical protein
MSDNDKRFHRLRSAAATTRELAGTWAKAKTHKLRARIETPDSWIAGGGTTDTTRWQDRRAKRDQLKEYHKVRQDGGVVATLLEARALMVFGPGGKFQSDDDAAAEWLNDEWNDRDNTLLDIGTDAYFYGHSLAEWRETRAGDFGEITLIEPHTTIPELDRNGEIEQWEQKIKTPMGKTSTQTFDPDDIMHFKTMKSSGRDPVGMSLLGRAMDEAKAYHDHQEAIDNAIQMQGFPKFHVKLGREDGAVIDDNELRRARPRFDNINELTKWVTGQDVDIDIIEAENFEFEGITEHDLSKLAIAFMLPVELTQIGGGDGLGTGFPAKLRRQLFLLGARSHQRTLGDQIVQQIGRPMLERYAPDDVVSNADDINLEFTFNDPITDMEELNTQVSAIGDDMTVNERRDLFGLSPLDDEETGEQFDTPGSGDAGPDDGLFMDDHELATDDDFWWEDWFDAAEEQMVWADDTDHSLFGFSGGETPAFIKAQLFEAVLEGSPIFSDIESIPNSELMDFRTFMADSLTDDGWTITEMRDEIADRFDVEPERAETMARSTTQNMVSEAAEQGYKQRDDFEDLRFTWPEINDGRDSDVCLSIVEAVPDEGLPLDDLKDTIHDVADEHDLDPRGWTPHPNCRRRPIRVT